MALTTSVHTPSTSKLSSATSMSVRSRLSGVIPILPGPPCAWLICCFCIAPPSPFQTRATSPRVRCRGATILTSRHVSREIALLYPSPRRARPIAEGLEHTRIFLPICSYQRRPHVPAHELQEARHRHPYGGRSA